MSSWNKDVLIAENQMLIEKQNAIIDELREEIKKLKKLSEIKAYQKEISNEIIIDNVAFTGEQICVINSINAIREYNQNQKAIECLKEVWKDFEKRLFGKELGDKIYVGSICNIINSVIDNKIKELDKQDE